MPIAANDNNPRLLTRADAAAYCACSTSTFSRWVAAGFLPKPLPNLRRWDRAAIDTRLNSLSGANDNRPTDAYEAWKATDHEG